MKGTRALTARRLLACAASAVFSAAVVRSHLHDRSSGLEQRVLVTIIVALPLAAAVALWSRRVIAQALSRGVWWCYLAMGAFAASSSGAGESRGGAFSALCAAVALLAAGRIGLDGASDDRFQPVAFRGTLLLSLVLAIADAVTLTSMGAVFRDPVLLSLGLSMFVGAVGLARLRTWGLIVALAANALVATLALTGTLPVSHLAQKLFTFTALLQLIVPLPMLVTLVRRRPPVPDRLQRARWTAATMAIVVLSAFSVYASFIDRTPFTR